LFGCLFLFWQEPPKALWVTSQPPTVFSLSLSGIRVVVIQKALAPSDDAEEAPLNFEFI
jgi:hypothetical protein